MEDHGDANETVLVLDAGVTVLRRVVAHTEVAVLGDARAVANGHLDVSPKGRGC